MSWSYGDEKNAYGSLELNISGVMMKPTVIIYGASGAIGSATAKMLYNNGGRSTIEVSG